MLSRVLLSRLSPGVRCIRVARPFPSFICSSMLSRARVYADVLVNAPKEVWDYEALNVTWG